MNKLKFAGLVASLAVLSGCSTISEDESAVVEVTEVNPVEVIDQPQANDSMIPDWYLNLPDDSAESIYGAGTGLSSDLQFSIDKALHQAKIVLGDKISNTVSSEIKTYMADNSAMGDNVVEETQRVSKSGFKNVDISNYKVQNKSVVKEVDRYRSFILLSINPIDRKPDLKDQSTPVDVEVIRSTQDAARDSMDNL